MPKVSILKKQMTIDVESGQNLMDVLLKAGLPVASSCHGEGICSMCKVKIEGQVNLPQAYEIECLRRNKCEPDERLSCQVAITHDIQVATKYW